MTTDSTSPIDIEGHGEELPDAWQNSDDIAWSFASSERVIGWRPEPAVDDELSRTRNELSEVTVGPQAISSLEAMPAILRVRDFGKRGFSPLSHWEGVVEEVNGSEFSCRLIPLGGQNGHDVHQFTEFSFEDLAVEEDRSLVRPGAIFYWTVGRARNEAGTLTNMSLVRFRRRPAATRHGRERAEREAEDLIRSLAHEDGSDSSGT